MSTVAPRPIDIVEGNLADLDAVMTIMDAAFDPAFGEAWSRGQCAGLLAQPRCWLTLARTGPNEMAGFALCHFIIDEAELLLIAVHPDYRGAGIARTLIEHCRNDASAMGAKRIHLEVREDNPAEHLYRQMGFETIGRRPKYYKGKDGQKYDAITLSYTINGRDSSL